MQFPSVPVFVCQWFLTVCASAWHCVIFKAEGSTSVTFLTPDASSRLVLWETEPWAVLTLTNEDHQLALLSAIVDSSDDAIISKDLNGIITGGNKSAERLFGYTPEESIGQPITILIPPDRQNEEPEIISRIRKGERVDHIET